MTTATLPSVPPSKIPFAAHESSKQSGRPTRGHRTYADANGWKLLDGNDRIAFVGTACQAILNGAREVKASFPCDAGVVRIVR